MKIWNSEWLMTLAIHHHNVLLLSDEWETPAGSTYFSHCCHPISTKPFIIFSVVTFPYFLLNLRSFQFNPNLPSSHVSPSLFTGMLCWQHGMMSLVPPPQVWSVFESGHKRAFLWLDWMISTIAAACKLKSEWGQHLVRVEHTVSWKSKLSYSNPVNQMAEISTINPILFSYLSDGQKQNNTFESHWTTSYHNSILGFKLTLDIYYIKWTGRVLRFKDISTRQMVGDGHICCWRAQTCNLVVTECLKTNAQVCQEKQGWRLSLWCIWNTKSRY